MATMTFTDLQANVTRTTTATGTAVDVGISLADIDWTIKVQVSALTAAKKARIVIEDTVNDWTAAVAGPVVSAVGLIASSFDKVYSWKKADLPDFRIGTASAQCRVKLALLDGATSVTYRAWLEY